MNCRSCGANLPPGSAFCTLCGAQTPYNMQPSGSGSPPQFDPTVAAPQYGYGTPDNPQQVDPTVMASPPPYGTPDAPPPPSTAYGAPSYGTPSYDAPSYGAPPPAPPYQPNQYSAGAPPAGGYGQPGTYGAFQQPPKPRSRLGLILGIIGGVLLLLCIGTCAVLYQVGKNSAPAINTLATTTSATETAAISTVTAVTGNLTPTTGSGQITAPSGQSIDPTAASIVTNPRTASAVDTNTAKPTKLATTFKVGSDVYVTVDLNLGGKTGYVQAKWYTGTSLVHTSKILNLNDPNFVHAYFGWNYDNPGQGITEVYWCSQSNCSDGKLATVIGFTVSSTSMHWTGQPVVTSMDINRPE